MPPKKRSRSSSDATDAVKECASSPPATINNDAVIQAFEELMVYESKDGNKWAGVAYNKVLAVLRGLKKTLSSGSEIASFQGVGKTSVEKIDEFLTTGKIKKLEDLKALHGALPSGMVIGGTTKSAAGSKASKAGGTAGAAAPPSKAQLAAIKKAAAELEEKPQQYLKDLCKHNKQVQSGTKADLVQRCSEGQVLGQIPICPFCGAGKLRYDIKTGLYKCPGYTDDDKYMPCVFQSGQVQRLPWQPLP